MAIMSKFCKFGNIKKLYLDSLIFPIFMVILSPKLYAVDSSWHFNFVICNFVIFNFVIFNFVIL